MYNCAPIIWGTSNCKLCSNCGQSTYFIATISRRECNDSAYSIEVLLNVSKIEWIKTTWTNRTESRKCHELTIQRYKMYWIHIQSTAVAIYDVITIQFFSYMRYIRVTIQSLGNAVTRYDVSRCTCSRLPTDVIMIQSYEIYRSHITVTRYCSHTI